MRGEDVMLIDSSRKIIRKFSVFNDGEIGIDAESQKIIMHTDMDDDCESS